MSIELRSSDHRREPAISLGEPLAFNCPKCSVRLHTHSNRTDLDDIGQLEQVYVYLCFKEGSSPSGIARDSSSDSRRLDGSVLEPGQGWTATHRAGNTRKLMVPFRWFRALSVIDSLRSSA